MLSKGAAAGAWNTLNFILLERHRERQRNKALLLVLAATSLDAAEGPTLYYIGTHQPFRTGAARLHYHVSARTQLVRLVLSSAAAAASDTLDTNTTCHTTLNVDRT